MAMSEFYADLSKFEPTVVNGMFTKKQFILLWEMAPVTAGVVALVVFVPGILGILLAVLVATILLAPMVLKWTGKWTEIRRSFDFYFIVKERSYQKRYRKGPYNV